jgi:hypothetical protein
MPMKTIAGIIAGIIISFGSYKIYKSFSGEDRRLIEGTKELETSLRINESLAIDYLSSVDEGSRASALLPLKENLDSDIRMYEMRLADVMGSDTAEFEEYLSFLQDAKDGSAGLGRIIEGYKVVKREKKDTVVVQKVFIRKKVDVVKVKKDSIGS